MRYIINDNIAKIEIYNNKLYVNTATVKNSNIVPSGSYHKAADCLSVMHFLSKLNSYEASLPEGTVDTVASKPHISKVKYSMLCHQGRLDKQEGQLVFQNITSKTDNKYSLSSNMCTKMHRLG